LVTFESSRRSVEPTADPDEQGRVCVVHEPSRSREQCPRAAVLGFPAGDWATDVLRQGIWPYDRLGQPTDAWPDVRLARR
jgi:hypothetical protein